MTSNNTEHFAPYVPQELRDILEAIAYEVKEEFFNSYSRELYGCDHLEPISGVGYSGFIPFQDGGYEVSDYSSNDLDPSNHIHPNQGAYLEGIYTDMLAGFARDVLDLPWEAAKVWAEGDYWSDLDERDEDYTEEFYDYEREWLGDALLRFEIWIDRKPSRDNNHWQTIDEFHEDQKVFWRLSANYRDAPYFRTTRDDTICQGSMRISTLMGQDKGALAAAFVRLLAKRTDDAWGMAAMAEMNKTTSDELPL
jgi:hypothetical protein